MANRSDRRLLNLLYIHQVFMEMRPEINMSQVSAFVAAAFSQPDNEDEEAPTIKELSALAGVPYSTMSRHYRYLGEKERHGKDGLGLVTVTINADDRRERNVHLTKAGNMLKEQLVELLM
ncbi:DNA-binding MarR family transcriptional regulator [Labrenzia sp. EL_208]|nr:DNA-binding MarR family transcriptional regulator [Labrenzia sp. EL_132]MBG6233421.1 DNA-binding MarR family transcriptional regulator [Labrenzia sp. EL_208]